MGVNRFIDYANPMYWAKMLRKGGIPKRKPYSFTVKINEFEHGTKEGKINSVSCKFGDQIILADKGESIVSGVYDSSAITTMEVEFNADSVNYEGFNVSGNTQWKITTKTGTVYQGIIGNTDTVSVLGLFSVERAKVPEQGETVAYYKQFKLTNIYDCVVLDGATLEFTPIFDTIGYNLISVLSEGLTPEPPPRPIKEPYKPTLWFKDGESGHEISKWITTQGGDERFYEIHIQMEDYMKESEWEPHFGPIKVDFISSSGVADYKYCKIEPVEGKYGEYKFTLYVAQYNSITKDEADTALNNGDYDVHIGAKKNTQITVRVAYTFKDGETYTVGGTVENVSVGRGLVQVNASEIGTDVYDIVFTGETATYNAFANGRNKFNAWYWAVLDEETGGWKRGEFMSAENPLTISAELIEEEGGMQLFAEFTKEEDNFFVKSKNYYGNTIKVEKQNGEDWETLIENVHEYSGVLKDGDIVKCTMSETTGFEDFKWRVGNQLISGRETGPITLDNANREFVYEMTLSNEYGVVFLENYPDELKNNGVKLSAYKTKCNVTSTYPADDEKYSDMKRANDLQAESWEALFENENYWNTKAFLLTDETGTDSRWWIKIVATPKTSEAGEIVAPYIVEWLDAVDPHSVGLGHQRIVNTFIDKNNKIIKLSCKLVPEADKNKYYRLTLKTSIEYETESKCLIHHDSNRLLWMSLIEHNPYVFGEIKQDNCIRFREVPMTITHGGQTYNFDTENPVTITCDPPITGENWYSVGIDTQGSGYITFENPFRAATTFEDVTIKFNYTAQTQTEEEFLKSNIAEAKEKLADAIEALEKDYDDGKEDVIEETPVKDEPDTDEADVAEAVLATEPTEDNE